MARQRQISMRLVEPDAKRVRLGLKMLWSGEDHEKRHRLMLLLNRLEDRMREANMNMEVMS